MLWIYKPGSTAVQIIKIIAMGVDWNPMMDQNAHDNASGKLRTICATVLWDQKGWAGGNSLKVFLKHSYSASCSPAEHPMGIYRLFAGLGRDMRPGWVSRKGRSGASLHRGLGRIFGGTSGNLLSYIPERSCQTMYLGIGLRSCHCWVKTSKCRLPSR